MVSYRNHRAYLVQAGGMLSNQGDWSQSSFYAGVLDTAINKYNRVKLSWNNIQKQYETKDNKSVTLPRKPSCERKLKVLPEVLEQMKLDEKQSISSSFLDYYIFPRIQHEEGLSGVLKDYTNAQEFIVSILAKGKAIISGGYNSGKTLLLKYLFLSLSDSHAVVFSGAITSSPHQGLLAKFILIGVVGHQAQEGTVQFQVCLIAKVCINLLIDDGISVSAAARVILVNVLQIAECLTISSIRLAAIPCWAFASYIRPVNLFCLPAIEPTPWMSTIKGTHLLFFIVLHVQHVLM